jgi:hypothetical protein
MSNVFHAKPILCPDQSQSQSQGTGRQGHQTSPRADPRSQSSSELLLMSDITQTLLNIARLCETLSRHFQPCHPGPSAPTARPPSTPDICRHLWQRRSHPGRRAKLEADRGTESEVLVARRCGIEGCQGGPRLWNIAAGQMNGAAIWRCLAHIPPDLTYPVSLWGDEWKATGRK